MTIGNPMHDFPSWVSKVLSKNVHEYRGYPPNDGTIGMRTAISDWLKYRYQVNYNAGDEIFPLNGTREGLFNAALALCPDRKNGNQSTILIPNPFYQVYSVAAYAANAKPVYVTASSENGFLPNYSALSSEILDYTVAAYICSPSNPQGSIASRAYWKELLILSEKYDFEVPPRTLESEFEQVWNQVEEARKNDKLDPEDVGKSDEDLRDQYKKISERRVRLGLLLNHVGESNELSVTQEEMNKAIMDHARQMPGQEQKVVEFYRENAEAQNSLRGPIFEDKVVNFIIEMADVTEKEITPEALRAEIEDEEKKPILEESSKGKEKKKSSTKRKASSVEKKSGGEKSEKSDKPKKSTKKGKK